MNGDISQIVAYEGSILTIGGIVSYNSSQDEFEMLSPKFIFSGGLWSLKGLSDSINKKYWSLALCGLALGVIISVYVALKIAKSNNA